MDVELKSIPVTLNFDFGQFLDFFKQLPKSEREHIARVLDHHVAEPNSDTPHQPKTVGALLQAMGNRSDEELAEQIEAAQANWKNWPIESW